MHEENLRDFYAGLAMMGLIASYKDDASVTGDYYTKRAFDIADAMMGERNRRKESEVNGRE